jgi:hypothetical protein
MATKSKKPVGYRNPPEENQFKKGQSGNPKGRPRREPVPEYGLKAAQELFHREMYRPISTRDGDKSVEMPALQALIRSTILAGIKGDRWARKLLLTTIERFENEEFTAQLAYFGQVLRMKEEWRDVVDICRKQRLPLPDPFPHPDDHHLDFDRAEVIYTGPSLERKERIDKMVRDNQMLQEGISMLAAGYRRAKPADQARWCSEWHREQLMFDMQTAVLPERYKTRLKDRSYHEGASRSDQTFAELREQLHRLIDDDLRRAGLPPRYRSDEDIGSKPDLT